MGRASDMGDGELGDGELRARLRDIERHLRDMPPHNASGSRDDLERQRVELQRRLSGPAAPGRPPDPRKGAPASPAASTPPLVEGGFRRTTHMAAGPSQGDYGDGVEVPRDVHGRCRDVRRVHGDLVVLGEEAITGHLDVERRMTSLTRAGGVVPDGLLGQSAMPGLRGVVAAAVDDTTTPLAAVLLDLGIGGNLAAYGRMQAARQAGKAGEVTTPKGLRILGDSCRGWALDGEVADVIRSGVTRAPRKPVAVPIPDEAEWHDLGDLPPWWIRRRRRIDVLDGGRRIEAAFRDSWADEVGVQRCLHEWELDLDVDRDGTVASAVATARSLPFRACPTVADEVPDLVGSAVGDLRHRTRDLLGGVNGCTHLNDLLSSIPAAVEAARREP